MFSREYQLALPRKEVEEVNNLRDRWRALMDLADQVSVSLPPPPQKKKPSNKNYRRYLYLTLQMLRTISTWEQFSRTENVPKISLLKVENCWKFSTSIFFPTENLCRSIAFHKIFFLRKIFPSGNGPNYKGIRFWHVPSTYIGNHFIFQVQSELMIEKRHIFEQELDKDVKVCTVQF
jgi:hypothetical protein